VITEQWILNRRALFDPDTMWTILYSFIPLPTFVSPITNVRHPSTSTLLSRTHVYSFHSFKVSLSLSITHSLNSADVPLSNKQTNDRTNLVKSWTGRAGPGRAGPVRAERTGPCSALVHISTDHFCLQVADCQTDLRGPAYGRQTAREREGESTRQPRRDKLTYILTNDNINEN